MERDHLEYLSVDRITILKIDLKQLEMANQYINRRGQQFGMKERILNNYS
jgi:hypothetical protein